MKTLSPSPEQLVTASELVRHFGLWQERAARTPLYVLHRGRPRFVLASVEAIEALGSGASASDSGVDAGALLDGVADLVLVADGEGRITASSRAARGHLGELARAGGRLGNLVPAATRPFFHDAIARVAASGSSEQLEIASPTRPPRMLAVTLAPMGDGTALYARDATCERDAARLLATATALGQAMAAAGGAAIVSLSPRGYIVTPDAALAALTGLTRETLATIRFVALAEIGARVALGDAVERVLGDGMPEALDSVLLVNRAAPRPVRIGLAPVRVGLAVAGAVASVVAHPG